MRKFLIVTSALLGLAVFAPIAPAHAAISLAPIETTDTAVAPRVQTVQYRYYEHRYHHRHWRRRWHHRHWR